jgi:hypothetical protein
VDTDPGAPDGVPFAAAGRLLAERGVYGLVWIDDDLTVTARYGRLADFVEVGEPITSSVPPLIGLERDVVALRHSLGTVVDIPAVSIIADGKQSPRLNLTVLWSTEEETYILLISRAVPRSDLQIEFSRQIRGRLLAEGELKRKSLDLAPTVSSRAPITISRNLPRSYRTISRRPCARSAISRTTSRGS